MGPLVQNYQTPIQVLVWGDFGSDSQPPSGCNSDFRAVTPTFGVVALTFGPKSAGSIHSKF